MRTTRACRPLRPADRLLARRPTRFRDLRRDSRDGVVVVRLDPEDARRLRRPEPGGVGHPERDRDLAEDVTGLPLADHALDAVDELDHLDPPLEHAEQRPLVALVHGVLAGAERDVGRDTTEPLAVGRSRPANSANRPISSAVTMRVHPAQRASEHSRVVPSPRAQRYVNGSSQGPPGTRFEPPSGAWRRVSCMPHAQMAA